MNSWKEFQKIEKEEEEEEEEEEEKREFNYIIKCKNKRNKFI